MKKTLLSFLLVISFLLGFSQDASVFDRINGVNFKGSLYINIDKDRTFYYVIDNDSKEHKITEDLYFKIKNEHKNDFQVYVQFYNPLSNTIKSTQKDLDDPAYAAISSFISKLPSLPQVAGTEAADKSSLAQIGDIEIKESTLLNEWLYKFITLIDPKYIAEEKLQSEYKDVVGFLNAIDKTENYLYGTYLITEPSIDGTERSLNDWSKYCSENLYKIGNDYDKFTNELKRSKIVDSSSTDYKKSASKNLSVIIDLMTKDFDIRIKPLIAKTMDGTKEVLRSEKDIAAFKNYSSAFAKSLNAITRPQFTLQEAVLKQLNDLNTKLDNFIVDFNETRSVGITTFHYKKDYSYMLDWKSTKMKSFTFNSQGLNKDGSEDVKSAKSSSFIVSKKLGVYPFVSTGVLFTNLSYPQYAVSTDNGTNTVKKTGEEKIYVRPTPFLNLLISSWDPMYPFAQIGVTIGKSDALFPVGVGLSFGSSFSFSFGCVFGYHKELNHLHEGGPVKDDAELQSDLTQKALFGGYFSLNYNIGKK